MFFHVFHFLKFVVEYLIIVMWPLLIIFGFHCGLIPIVMNNISVYGGDFLLPCTVGTNFAMAGAVLGIITEPAIYGLNLKYKRPFVIACLCSGIGGIFVAGAGVMFPSVMTTSLLTIPALAGIGGASVLIAALIGFFGSAILTYLFGFNDSMVEEE